MQKHQPSSKFYLYVANAKNMTAYPGVVHNALYARNYAKYAEMAGINYTVYYTDYSGMTQEDAGAKRFEVQGSHRGEGFEIEVFNYRSSHNWAERAKSLEHVSSQEQLLYHCLTLDVECSSPSPTPAPSPSPSPSPTPSSISDSCKKEIDNACAVGVDCKQCIREHGGNTWVRAG